MNKKIALINACTDFGINVDGAGFGPQILTQDLLNNSNHHHYLIKQEGIKEKIDFKTSNYTTIDDFIKDFRSLLLKMHEQHFEQQMNDDELRSYCSNMQNLVLAIKALEGKKKIANLSNLDTFNKKLYETVTQALCQNEFPITIGGDHIIAIASSLASIKMHKNLGIIWFDSHADFNTYDTSVTGNLHGLPLAVVTHYEKQILSNFHNGPFYKPQNTVIVGGRDIDPWEFGNLINAGITVFSTQDIKNLGIETVCNKAFKIASKDTNGVHISFDLDLIDPKVAPGVSVPAENGINLTETYKLIDEICKFSNIIKSADLVEFNPSFDQNHVTENIAKAILNKWILNFG